ncbi:lipocalin-like domain-containing protein [Elizabethkingia anophelis]|uniref:lipocalin-like domain-containing protein n=1 Tax=Elizabethkingia anophelis TaxID=1117645 RepID=UPI000B35B0AB|nr:lipocalin-like domain-containing protein [Elizabethkingia anophelis]MCT4203487.1 lipocalin-like domain-containing protein [Elizabethkingia anophelis]MCT4207003.1 lipocalin-like domain-containing protein [Elizabethkingia anophelis]HAY3543591.1 hypothetical protein [Elizabethkingia anophelis]
MKNYLTMISAGLLLSAFSCQQKESTTKADILDGTYRLVGSETVKGTDTIRTTIDPAKTEMIKMFNDSHFAFLNHDKSKGKDSLKSFSSGAGTYQLKGKEYTENLEYCSYREWEGRQFHFTLEKRTDTLIQTGEEDIPELGIKQKIKEVYIKVK